ncbi:MAG TPA: ribose 5-phosphate isomerase B [Anaerolineae bacterium]|nr:ribose 5-phosphate isomerase B [Anaerolineae bacterium]
MTTIKISLGCDHAGFEYKEAIKEHLTARGIQVQDFGTDSDERVDYPDYIRPAALAVARGECDGGIVLGGSGNGEAIVSNKVRGIRCAVCWDEYTARMGKAHNDANMISIGQRTIPLEMALRIVDTWLDATFEGGRHQNRLEKVAEYDQGYI